MVHVPYTYILPEERIAQRPVHPPESAKMLVVDRNSGDVSHSRFASIAEYLRPTDHLIFNDTKVIPARLFGTLNDGNGHPVQIVLLRQIGTDEWSAIGYPMRRIRVATQVCFSSELVAEVLPSPTEDRLRLRFIPSGSRGSFELIQEQGTMPIPPYIRDGRGDAQDRVDYQSIFAQYTGSVAAPTASLHFSEHLMSSIRSSVGCQIDTLTLHVGAASFQPIMVNGVLRPPGEEHFHVPAEIMGKITETKARGGRVIAVGTTVVRALESAARGIQGGVEGETSLFIQPGFEFKGVDALVTNFHQPSTTHLLLVEALIGRELLDRAYQTALATEYRFLSYGDGMLIV